MKSITFYDFIDRVKERTTKLQQQAEILDQAAQLCASRIRKGGRIFIFGTGHSVGFGMEFQNRVQSLDAFVQMKLNDFVLKGRISYERLKDKTNMFERQVGFVDQLFEMYDIQENDGFIIVSNSGINGAIIDLALLAQEKKMPTIVVTSMEHTLKEASRHPSGKKLYQLAQLVIDNCGPWGDALIEVDHNAKLCSISSITGALIAHAIENKTRALLKEDL